MAEAEAAAERSIGLLVGGASRESCLVRIVIVNGVGALVFPVNGIVARKDAVGVEVLQSGPGDKCTQSPE